LDVAIITKQSPVCEKLNYEPLIKETFMVVCGSSFDTSEFDEVAQSARLPDIEKWLKKQAWNVYSSNLTIARRFWRENFKKRPMLKLATVVPDNNALLEITANSDILAVASDLIAGKMLSEGRIRVLWRGVSPATNTLYLAYDKSNAKLACISEAREFIRTSLQLAGFGEELPPK
jgi:DNA-binding transcriptional LysR family regulator